MAQALFSGKTFPKKNIVCVFQRTLECLPRTQRPSSEETPSLEPLTGKLEFHEMRLLVITHIDVADTLISLSFIQDGSRGGDVRDV